MLFQKITWMYVAVLCLAIHYVNSVEISCHVNNVDQCVFEEDVAWDGKEELKIINSDKLAESITDIVLKTPFKTKVIPTEIFVKFPNLKSLSIYGVGLETVSSDDFVNANKLNYLSISFNNITILKANSFSAAKNLGELALVYNKITKIEEGAFEGLRELTTLSLNGNDVVGLDITQFAKIPKLSYFSTANMDFTFSGPFKSEEAGKIVNLNSTITKLDLSNNLIDNTDLWRRISIFPNLETASFSGNKITHVDHMDEFKNLLPRLVYLIIKRNPFEAKWLEEAKVFFEKAEVNFWYD